MTAHEAERAMLRPAGTPLTATEPVVAQALTLDWWDRWRECRAETDRATEALADFRRTL